MADSPNRPAPLSLALIALMKGVQYAEDDPTLWQSILSLQARLIDHVQVMGLDLVVDEVEGYAFLKQRVPGEGEPELPRLMARRQLSYGVSLMLVLLRKKFMELDAAGGETRLIVKMEDLVDLVRTFLAPSEDEVRVVGRIERDVEAVVKMGFLRRMRGHDDQFEVRRIIKAFVDGQWTADFEKRLAEYHASGLEGGTEADT